MSRAVNVVLGIQIIFSAFFMVPASMADSSAGLGLLALYFYYVVFFAPFAIFGLVVLCSEVAP